MTDKKSADRADLQSTSEVVQATMQEFLQSADVARVYGRPVRHQEVTIIPAAEVVVAMGFGIGAGAASDETQETGTGTGFGGGGGGGGKTLSRPVALVVSTPDGVRVEPVIDPTKVAMAAITAVGFMGGMLFRLINARFKMRRED